MDKKNEQNKMSLAERMKAELSRQWVDKEKTASASEAVIAAPPLPPTPPAVAPSSNDKENDSDKRGAVETKADPGSISSVETASDTSSMTPEEQALIEEQEINEAIQISMAAEGTSAGGGVDDESYLITSSDLESNTSTIDTETPPDLRGKKLINTDAAMTADKMIEYFGLIDDSIWMVEASGEKPAFRNKQCMTAMVNASVALVKHERAFTKASKLKQFLFKSYLSNVDTSDPAKIIIHPINPDKKYNIITETQIDELCQSLQELYSNPSTHDALINLINRQGAYYKTLITQVFDNTACHYWASHKNNLDKFAGNYKKQLGIIAGHKYAKTQPKLEALALPTDLAYQTSIAKTISQGRLMTKDHIEIHKRLNAAWKLSDNGADQTAFLCHAMVFLIKKSPVHKLSNPASPLHQLLEAFMNLDSSPVLARPPQPGPPEPKPALSGFSMKGTLHREPGWPGPRI